MALKIFYTDRIELLADALSRKIGQCRLQGDPLEFVDVITPNTNIATWLRVRIFAKSPESSAGVDFPFFDAKISQLLLEFIPQKHSALKLITREQLASAIAEILLDKERFGVRELDCFRSYITAGHGDRYIDNFSEDAMARLWQLARCLAGYFAEYDMRRPDIVQNWLKETSLPPASTAIERAEASLMRVLFSTIFAEQSGLLSLRQLFDAAQCRGKIPPKRTIFVFGLSSLSPLHAQILHFLASTHDVFFYHYSVCHEYWGDIREILQEIRRTQREIHNCKNEFDEALNKKTDNPMLVSWGAAGAETMGLLVDLEEAGVELNQIDGSTHEQNECNSVLEAVQYSIRNRTSELKKRIAQDSSLQIVACPSEWREVETVYNSILTCVATDRDTTFSDIALLVPDMDLYRPIIDAVFSSRGQIPHGMIDTAATSASFFLQGLFGLFRLALEGLNRERLFLVLDNPHTQRALGFTATEVRDWKELTNDIGAFDSFDDDDAARRGLAPTTYFTWDYALCRIRLANVADRIDSVPIHSCECGLRLSEIVEELFVQTCELRKKLLPAKTGNGEDWSDVVTKLADRFLSVPPDNPLELAIRAQIISSLDALANTRSFNAVSLAFIHQYLRLTSDSISCRKGGYLTSGVTIASLQPMRPIPFKHVFILGLGEGHFPGVPSQSALDIRTLRNPRLADATIREINKFLFLETLTVTTKRLVLSYVCDDIQKDCKLFPCSLVRDLEDFCASSIFPSQDKDNVPTKFCEINVPLLESDIRAMADPLKINASDAMAGIVETFSTKNRIIADSAGRGGIFFQNQSLFPPIFSSPPPPVAEPDALNVRIDHLAAFLRCPHTAFLENRLGIARERYRDTELEINEPLTISDRWKFTSDIVLAALSTDKSAWSQVLFRELVNKLFRTYQTHGIAPLGVTGSIERVRTLIKADRIFGAIDAARELTCGRKPSFLRFGDVRPRDSLLPAICFPEFQCETKSPPGRAAIVGETKFFFPANTRQNQENTLIFSSPRKLAVSMRCPSADFLAPFIAMAALKATTIDNGTFVIAAVCEAGLVAFQWDSITAEQAHAFLKDLLTDYLDYPGEQQDNNFDSLPTYRYDNLMEALKDDDISNSDETAVQALEKALAEQPSDEYSIDASKLVIDNLMKQKTCVPSHRDCEAILRRLRLFLKKAKRLS